ncbi:MAG: hypothetical protein AAF355_13355 [Myxococcota bacterium]
MPRLSWSEICADASYQGRWVALDGCLYDTETGNAAEGSIVDCDESLTELCFRLQAASRRNCAIVFCAPEVDSMSVDPVAVDSNVLKVARFPPRSLS